ncbi:hypothetical protein BDV96DRAFT_606700 [Lophiotrema nucula]|uniref:Phospholipid/glycerol acyltransferase domain-containing protein n=1 Tax=Lophiotrema nucula TaxID=690887 RepID=A0A6A5YJ51_9PLEO|nr:hypothetical protein BDV96DRAFT_606700 [Lophiotrema nucula]
MEKYSQFRDKGTAIAPFFPVSTPPSSAVWTPVHIFLFTIRAPAVFCLSIFHFVILEFLPVGSFVRRCLLWLLLAVPGVWWVDLQVDGVKRGYGYTHPAMAGFHSTPLSFYYAWRSISAENAARNRKLAVSPDHLPYEGTIIASSFTSPLDPLYLAGIFSPIFTRSYPSTRKVEPISLFRAILLAFSNPTVDPPNPKLLVTLEELKNNNPRSIICVFPECTTTNGRGILPFSPSLLTADPKTRIYPVNLRYTPGDITTPVPGSALSWFWRLLSKPTHIMRVRVARPTYNNAAAGTPNGVDESIATGYDTNIFDSPGYKNGYVQQEKEGEGKASKNEQEVLDRIGEDLARLGRVKRVGLDVQDKIDFVKVWSKRR